MFFNRLFIVTKRQVGTYGPGYLGLNLAGSLLVLVSLVFHWNLPAFLLEAAWALISMYGIWKYIIADDRKRQ